MLISKPCPLCYPHTRNCQSVFRSILDRCVLSCNQINFFLENMGSLGLLRFSMGSLGFLIRIPYLSSLFGLFIWFLIGFHNRVHYFGYLFRSVSYWVLCLGYFFLPCHYRSSSWRLKGFSIMFVKNLLNHWSILFHPSKVLLKGFQ